MVFKGLKKFTDRLIGTTHVSYDDGLNEEDDYIEVKPAKDSSSTQVLIKYFIINDYSDVKSILEFVREGSSVIFANIKPLKTKDITELKRAISKIKKTCEAVGGDIVGIEENFILIYPDFASVSKEDFE